MHTFGADVVVEEVPVVALGSVCAQFGLAQHVAGVVVALRSVPVLVPLHRVRVPGDGNGGGEVSAANTHTHTRLNKI